MSEKVVSVSNIIPFVRGGEIIAKFKLSVSGVTRPYIEGVLDGLHSDMPGLSIEGEHSPYIRREKERPI